MISIDEARGVIAAKIGPLPPEPVPLADLTSAILREQVTANAAYPPADCSMMDGYAIDASDRSERFEVVMEIAAGTVPARALRPGECARIFTGGTLPAGASQVIPQENVDREGAEVKPRGRGGLRFVRARGAEAQAGDVLLRNGAALGGAELAILAQAGCVQPRVAPTPRIVHIVTGDELVEPSETPGPGKIRDSNSSLLRGLFAAWGVGSLAGIRCGDDLPRLIAACGSSMDQEKNPVHLLLISGGASVGDYDFGARVLRELKFAIHFERINLRPGKPLIFATRGPQAAFVIPGNPVSHFVCFHVAIRLALERLRGAEPAWSFVDVELGGGDAVEGNPRETFCPATVVVREGRLLAVPKRWSSSGDTFALAGTNALIRLAPDGAAVEPGGRVRVLLLDLPRAD